MAGRRETDRIQLIHERDGLDAAITWVERTLQTYAQALNDAGHFARTAQYRPLFEESVREFQAWLAQQKHQTGENAMQIREVMTDRVKTVKPETRVPEIARIMRDEDIGAVPVTENDKLIGMVTDRDIVVRAMADGANVDKKSAREVMSPRLLYCREDQSVDEVLRNMGEQQVRRLPVVNRDKRLVGMVSLGDLSGKAPPNKAGETLKEISKPASH